MGSSAVTSTYQASLVLIHQFITLPWVREVASSCGSPRRGCHAYSSFPPEFGFDALFVCEPCTAA